MIGAQRPWRMALVFWSVWLRWRVEEDLGAYERDRRTAPERAWRESGAQSLVAEGQTRGAAGEFVVAPIGIVAGRQKRRARLKRFFSNGASSCGQGGESRRYWASGWSACLGIAIELEEQLHGLATVGAERRRVGRTWQWRWRAEENGPAGVQLDAQPVGGGGGVTKAVVTDRAQRGGQDVAQVVTQELETGQVP